MSAIHSHYWNQPSTSTFYLKSYGAGPADAVYTFGPAGAGWQPISGDWDGSTNTTYVTVGLYNKNNAT